LVVDTNVMVAAIRSDAGASRRLLRAGLQRRCVLLISVPLMAEYQALTTRLEHLTASHLSAADVGHLLDAIVPVAEPVWLGFLWRPLLRDPDDDMGLEAAVNGRAELLVTFNRRDFGVVGECFGIRACSPGEAVRDLEQSA
jgi:putative PIN family toxin of toxin-antitoxin system